MRERESVCVCVCVCGDVCTYAVCVIAFARFQISLHDYHNSVRWIDISICITHK